MHILTANKMIPTLLVWTTVVICAAYADSLSASPSLSSTLTTTPWSYVEQAPPDAILGIAAAYHACQLDNKVNVCVGAYRDEDGQPWVLPSVRQAEHSLWEKKANKEYLPIEGDVDYVKLALEFAYGSDMDLERVAGVQSLSGTGACRIGGHFLARHVPGKPIYIPTPTWGNHWKIFAECGIEARPYRYYNRNTNALDYEGLLQDLQDAPEGSVILLHACAHNPTGCDPTREQWQKIAQVLLQKQHVAFLDSAYQGFASGDAEGDAFALRFLTQQNVPLMLAQSFAKNFGLYGERCGTFSVVCDDADQAQCVVSQLRTIIRPMYSSPPKHGSSIVKTVLGDDTLKVQYYKECAHMADRINSMRQRLAETLVAVGSKHDWSHITSQIGMFAFTGMSAEMCDQLTDEYAIFLTRDGRISLAGLNENNLEYVAKAINAVTDGKSITGN